MTLPSPETAPPNEPIFNVPGVVLVLLAGMVGVHLLISLADIELAIWAINTFGFVPARYAEGGEVFGGGFLGLIWPFVTHTFVHGSVAHLGLNSLWLLAVGSPLARRLGVVPFLFFYFVCGAFAAAAHLAVHFGSPVPVVGASGAVAGCMAASARLIFSPTARYFLMKSTALGTLAPLSDRRVVSFALVWTVLNIVFGAGFVAMPGTEGAVIAWEAHIGGFFAGLLLLPLFDRWAGGGTRFYPRIDRPGH